MTWNRGRALLSAAAALTVLGAWCLPLTSEAVSPPLACGEASAPTPWQSTPIPPFPGVQNVTTSDRVTSYGLDDQAPSRVAVTNGTTVQASTTAGCTWRRILTLDATPATTGGPSGVTARIVQTALLSSGRGVLAIQDGNGSASRPRIMSSPDGAAGGYVPTESGLPQQGTPGVLAAARDGVTVYLTIQPTGGGGSPLPIPLPVPLPTQLGGAPAAGGLVYLSKDGGQTWSLRTTTADAAAGSGRVFTRLVVGASDSSVLYGVASGKLLHSTDGGATFSDITPVGIGTVTAAADAQLGFVVAAGSNGVYFVTEDGKRSFRFPGLPSGATDVALRDDGVSMAIESGGQVSVAKFSTGMALQDPANADEGTVRGDYGSQSTFHAIAGHQLLRYSDPVSKSGGAVGPAIGVKGDVPPVPPRNGVVAPNGLTVTLPPGGSKTVHYSLALPDDPTPLNIFYLVDISSTLTDYQDQLKRNIGKISVALAAKRISLRVGVGTLGTGPSDGKPPYPDTSATSDGNSTPNGGYHKPTLYHLLRRLGPADAGFYKAVSEIQTETLPYPQIYGKNDDAEEGQLLSLEQAATGSGVLSPQSTAAVPQYSVPGGQEAGFEPNPFVRNVIVMATDEFFANPAGSPRKPDGSLDFDRVIGELKALRIQQLGLTIGTTQDDSYSSFNDLARVARGTGAIAPPGGIKCSDTEIIDPGKPIVCTQPDNFSQLLVSVLGGLRDVQTLSTRRTGNPLAITATSQTALTAVDVTKAHVLPFTVTYSCAGLAAGSYPTKVDTLLRGYVVGSASATVTCLAAPALIPAVVLPIPPVRPLLRVVPPPPPAAPPAPPQVPPQGQVQSQVNPVSAAALQEEQQLQLALATNSLVPPEPDKIELAMVDRRQRQEHSAMVLLAAAMAAASVGGVVRLKVRPDPQVVRAR